MKIILDTNILRRDWLLESVDFQNLIKYSKKTMSSIVLSNLVLNELGRLYQQEITKVINSICSKTAELNRMMFDREYPLPKTLDCETYSTDYKRYIKQKFGENILTELPVKPDYWTITQERWLKSIKPFSLGRDAFRDTVIWLSLMDYLKSNKHEEFIFITDNHKDFGNQEGNDLHPDLRAEANTVTQNLKFYRSLSDFCSQYVSPTNFITEAWLIANIDWDRLNSKVLEGVSSIHCGFFFEDYGRRLGHINIQSWEVLKATYIRSIDMFLVNSLSENGYSVWLPLGGPALIRYFSDNGEIYPLETYFTAEVTIEIRHGKIYNYKDYYYEEETCLALIDKS